MKKTIFACMALAYAGLAFSEPAILTEAKNYKLSNGQTMEQVLANYSHCDQKEWGVVDNRAIFVCRDQEYTKTLVELFNSSVDEIWVEDEKIIEKLSKASGKPKEKIIEKIQELKKNPRLALAKEIELNEKNKKARKFTASVNGVSEDELAEGLHTNLQLLNAFSTKEDFFVVYFDRENGNVVANYADMHYWIDVNGKVNYKGAMPAVVNYEDRLIKNIPVSELSFSDEDGEKFTRTLMDAYAQAEAKAKKESSK